MLYLHIHTFQYKGLIKISLYIKSSIHTKTTITEFIFYSEQLTLKLFFLKKVKQFWLMPLVMNGSKSFFKLYNLRPYISVDMYCCKPNNLIAITKLILAVTWIRVNIRAGTRVVYRACRLPRNGCALHLVEDLQVTCES